MRNMTHAKRVQRGFPSGTVILRTTGCRMFNGLVYVCKDCAAGQRYCYLSCRAAARRQQTRDANRRYLATVAGKARNRERQQRFRERRRNLNASRTAVSSSEPLFQGATMSRRPNHHASLVRRLWPAVQRVRSERDAEPRIGPEAMASHAPAFPRVQSFSGLIGPKFYASA